MDPLDDVRIDSGLENPPQPDPDGPPRAGLPRSIVVGIVVAIIGLAVAAWMYFGQRGPEPAAKTASSQPASPDTRAPLGSGGPAADLPPLFLTDPLVRELIGRLSSHPAVMSWLATEGLIRNVVVCIENVAEGQSPARHLPRLAPKAPFAVVRKGGAVFIDPSAYARYDGIADAAASLDPVGLAGVYARLKPRMVEAYRDLGHPDGDLDGATERAIVVLLRTPALAGDLPLTEKVLSYRFQSDAAEELEPAQKQLLRMGPRNQRLIQDHLRAVARALGIPETRLPAPPRPAASGR